MQVNRKRLLLLGVPLLLFSMIIFHRPLICFVLKQVLVRQMNYLKPTHVSYGHLGYNDGSIYLDNISLFHPEMKRELLHIDSVECHVLFDCSAKTFHTSYKVMKPSMTWYQTPNQVVQEIDLYKILSLPQFAKKVIVEQGAIECITPRGSMLVHLSFHPGVEGTHMGSIDVCVDSKLSQDSHLTVDLYNNVKDLMVHMKVKELPLAALNPFLSLIRHIHVERGILNGALQLGMTAERKLHSVKSDLNITQLTLVDEHESSFAEFNECRLRATLPLDHQNKIDLTHVSIPILMRYLVSTCELEGGTVCFNNPKTHSLWQFRDLETMFTCNLAHTPSLSIKGELEKDSVVYPFTLQGKGVIESEQNWWMDIEMHHSSGAAPIPLYIALLDGKEHFIKASVQQLGPQALHMIQDLALMWIPSLDKVRLHEGSLTTDLIVRIEENKIHTVALESLTCSSIHGVWLEKGWEIQCREMQGKIKLHFPLFKNMKAPAWEISYQDLSVEEQQTKVMLASSGFISSKEWKIASSWITTQCQGVTGEWHLSGPYADLELAGSCKLNEKHLASDFQEEVCKVAEHLQKLQQVECSLKIKHNKNQFNVLGIFHLGYTGDILDKIRFGMDVSAEELKQGILFNQGWFQSDKLSEHTYLWFVKHYKQRWHALGNMKVTGEFNREVIHFFLESQEAVYDSEDILVTMGPGEQVYTGDFTFDLQKKNWLIHLPIVQAAVTDKRFKLPFKEVKADVTIQGMHLAAENIQALCEHVDFRGRLDLDFTDPEWIDLKLYPQVMRGEVQDFLQFLRYLPDFHQIQLPLTGRVEGDPYNYLFTQYNDTESAKTSKIAFKVFQGTYPINETSAVRDISFGFLWDSHHNSLEVKDLSGDLYLRKEEEQKTYHLNAQNLISNNVTQGEWEFDLRVEAPTFDVLRLAGSSRKEGEAYVLHLEPHLTHFFGSKLRQIDLAFTPTFELHTLALEGSISLTDALSQLQWVYLAGILDMQQSLFHEIKTLKAEGDLTLKIAYARQEQHMAIDIKSDELSIDQIAIRDFSLRAIQQDKRWTLEHLKTQDFSAHALAVKEGEIWQIFALQAAWLHSSLAIKRGSYKAGTLDIELDHLTAHLEDLQMFYLFEIVQKKLFGDVIHAQGRAIINLSSGLKKATLLTELMMHSEALGEKQLELHSQIPFKASYSHEEGIAIEHLHLHVQKKDLSEVWTSAEIRYAQMSLQESTCIGKGIKMTIPPEMLRYLAQLKLISQIGIEGQHFTFFENTFIWDNQIETEFDFAYDPHSIQIQGIAKDGYYWIGEKSVYFQNIHYFLDQDQLNLIFGWDYQDISLDFFTKIQLKEGLETIKEGMEAKVTIKEGHAGDLDERASLDVVCRYSQEDGFYCQSIEGTLYGVEFSFRRNPRTYLPSVIILTGQMKVDTSGLVKAFPSLFYQAIKDLGMGSGYELSGDWVFSKRALDSSYFKGFLKGRDFEFLGFYFKTLLSEVEINRRGVVVQDFRLSDLSGVAQIKEARVHKSEEDGSWKLTIPEITVQDFRPSFLKKNDGTEERIKPFVIKDLHFCDIQGTLGYKESFSGKGHLDFINTFKRETNLLDIPIEIIGRIGFDLGLLVPVIGKLTFEMTEGKIFLKELTSTYSEGKRSKFYLSGHKDSYIGLDGALRIDIKMKQYVLLKITQPFTLSIRGTLIKPKYSLR